MSHSRIFVRSLVICLGLLQLSSGFAADSAPCDTESLSATLPTVKSESVTAPSCELLKPTKEEIRSILLKAFGSHTHTLNRRVDVFHYGSNPTGKEGVVATDDHELAERYFYDKKSGHSFFNPEKGYMLYTANNPLVSLDYSGEPPLLLKITVPPGVRYLDGVDPQVSPEENAKIWCYLDTQTSALDMGSEFTRHFDFISDKQFILASKETRAILQSVFKELKIQLLVDGFRNKTLFKECFGQNPQIKFIDPELSPKLEKTLFTLKLEDSPSPKKLEAYRELLQYFDRVDPADVTKIGNGVEPSFWKYYRSWAPIVYKLPPGTDLIKFQKEQFLKTKGKRGEIVRKMLGCSNDPKFKDEIIPE